MIEWAFIAFLAIAGFGAGFNARDWRETIVIVFAYLAGSIATLIAVSGVLR